MARIIQTDPFKPMVANQTRVWQLYHTFQWQSMKYRELLRLVTKEEIHRNSSEKRRLPLEGGAFFLADLKGGEPSPNIQRVITPADQSIVERASRRMASYAHSLRSSHGTWGYRFFAQGPTRGRSDTQPAQDATIPLNNPARRFLDVIGLQEILRQPMVTHFARVLLTYSLAIVVI
jgi:hypothetical protein